MAFLPVTHAGKHAKTVSKESVSAQRRLHQHQPRLPLHQHQLHHLLALQALLHLAAPATGRRKIWLALAIKHAHHGLHRTAQPPKVYQDTANPTDSAISQAALQHHQHLQLLLPLQLLQRLQLLLHLHHHRPSAAGKQRHWHVPQTRIVPSGQMETVKHHRVSLATVRPTSSATSRVRAFCSHRSNFQSFNCVEHTKTL